MFPPNVAKPGVLFQLFQDLADSVSKSTTTRWRCEQTLKLDTLGQAEGILDLHSKIQHRAVYFAMSQEQLDRSQVPGFAIDQRSFGSSHRVCRI